MLWASLEQDGILRIKADKPIEAYALEQWKEKNKISKIALSIETGVLIDIEQLTRALAKDGVDFNKWKRQREHAAVISREDAETLGIVGSNTNGKEIGGPP